MITWFLATVVISFFTGVFVALSAVLGFILVAPTNYIISAISGASPYYAVVNEVFPVDQLILAFNSFLAFMLSVLGIKIVKAII